MVIRKNATQLGYILSKSKSSTMKWIRRSISKDVGPSAESLADIASTPSDGNACEGSTLARRAQ